MSKERLLTIAAGATMAWLLLMTVAHGADPNYLIWTAAQMADFDKRLVSTLDATKGRVSI